jgi:hypothetical protein
MTREKGRKKVLVQSHVSSGDTVQYLPLYKQFGENHDGTNKKNNIPFFFF